MTKKGRKGNKIWLLLFLLLAVLLLWPQTMKYSYDSAEKPVANPLKGWVRWGENIESAQDASLAYVTIRWDSFEPQKGAYQFESLEKQWNFDAWRAQGVHLILRVVADTPSAEGTLGIPQWLYDEMQGSGTYYDSSYGKGFSPDYTHPAMIEAHRRLLLALGQRYDSDAQIACVQLGSLGHWGEWHVNQKAGIAPFPALTIAEQYIAHYTDAFSRVPLMMRRPYPVVAETGMGLYNDSLGNADSDARFLSWIENGYVSDQTGESLPSCSAFWKNGFSGGELAPSIDMETHFTENFDALLYATNALHTTWIGPNSPMRAELSEQAQQNMDLLAAQMGYCYTIRGMTAQKTLLGTTKVQVDIENLGSAPLYAAWPVRIELRDSEGVLFARYEVSADENQWVENGKIICRLPRNKQSKKSLQLWLGIVDPMTNTCRVAFANDLPQQNGMYCLGKLP